MHPDLKTLIDKTIIFQYELPKTDKGITKATYSTEPDKCYSVLNDNSLSDIIYRSIIDYAFNEYEIAGRDLQALHYEALSTRIRFNEAKGFDVQIKYGFFGEVLLYCFLCNMFGAKPLISKGFFYSPTENSESKGYDSYHLIEDKTNGEVELWFGEVKFYAAHDGAIKSALGNIDKTLSDAYFQRNIHVLPKLIPNFDIKGSKIETIIQEWREKPQISVLEEMKKHKITLIYPILILYDGDKNAFDDAIKKAIEYITKNYPAKTFTMSIPVKVFFIFSPVESTKEVKLQVLKWIKAKKSVTS